MERRAGLIKLRADALVTNGAGGERHIQLGTSCAAANGQVMPARMASAALLIHLLFAGSAADTHHAAIHHIRQQWGMRTCAARTLLLYRDTT